MKKKTSGKLTNIVLVLIFLAGLSLLLYPTVSDYWNSLHASRAVSEYAEQVNALDQDRYKDLWKQAVDYNRTLLDRVNSFTLTEEQQERIGDCLPQRISAVEGPWVLALPGYAAPDYQTVAALADRLFPFAKRGPMRICLEADMAKALGQALALRVGQHAEIVCIDRVKLSENQYLDIGLPQGPAFPVVVKTLVFGA